MTTGYLDVGDGHSIYYEAHGAPAGQPVFVLHGGPGGGLQRRSLTFFDLRRWRVILADQRGCGRSKPHLSTHANTTWHLVADIERLRQHLGIDRMFLFGGSWGSTLALAYASRHGERVQGMILRGVCLMEPWETEWLYGPTGVARIFPREYAKFIAGGASTRRDRTAKAIMSAYGRRLRQNRTRRAAARRWWGYEAALSHLTPTRDNTPPKAVDALAVLEQHYFSHNAWLRPGELLRAARGMRFPVRIVQGRYDMICPAASAVSLADALPNAVLTLTQAGHAASEPATAAALRAATTAFIA